MLSPPITLSRPFVEELLDAGTATVAPFDAASVPVVDGSAREAIAECETVYRLELAGDVPAFHAGAAEWGLVQFYRFAQLLVSRDTPAEVVSGVVGLRFAEEITPSIVYSADLFFRLVPDLFRRANEAAPGDPLVEALKAWAAAWPLSSVRIPLERPPSLAPISADAALWRLYVDRVTAGHASDRWADSGVAAQLRTDLGAFSDLAPSVLSALDRLSTAARPSA